MRRLLTGISAVAVLFIAIPAFAITSTVPSGYWWSGNEGSVNKPAKVKVVYSDNLGAQHTLNYTIPAANNSMWVVNDALGDGNGMVGFETSDYPGFNIYTNLLGASIFKKNSGQMAATFDSAVNLWGHRLTLPGGVNMDVSDINGSYAESKYVWSSATNQITVSANLTFAGTLTVGAGRFPARITISCGASKVPWDVDSWGSMDRPFGHP